jgi:hypothetical protein
VQDDPACGDQPVQAPTIAQEGLALSVPEPVVLDRDPELWIGEIHPGDESVFVEHPELRNRQRQPRPPEEKPQPGLLG